MKRNMSLKITYTPEFTEEFFLHCSKIRYK